MCNYYTCRRSLALIFLCLNCILVQSQTSISQRYSGVALYRSASPELLPPKGNDDIITNERAWQLWKNLQRSIDPDEHRGITEIRNQNQQQEQENSTIVIYPVIKSFLEPSQQDGQILDTAVTVFMAMSQSHYQDRQVRFYLPSATFWHDVAGTFEFNFDDGLGWRSIELDQYVEIHYSDLTLNRNIQIRVKVDGDWKTTSTALNAASCQNTLWLPHLPTWPIEDQSHPWRVHGTFENQVYNANAYTLWSEDGVLDKPFIFVEGIDFSVTHSTYANGDFGWCQFMGLDAENYPMLANSSQLYSSLRARGYDLILIDFDDGAADIRGNAQALKRLISLCNLNKVGSEELIIAGASMGGQVARIAISEMENAGIPVCAGAYISMDSPHLGANIPIGLQAGIHFLAEFSSDAEAFVSSALARPAAQQLLIYQWLDSEGNVDHPWKREEYMNYIQQLPFPSSTYNVAIANGNIGGQALYNWYDQPWLLKKNCDAFSLLPGNEFQLRLSALPGDLTHEASTAEETVICDAIYTETSWAIPPTFSQHHIVSKVPANMLPIDYAAGGVRQSVQQLVDVLNDNSTFTGNCGVIESDQYTQYHSFVPTYSALAVDTTWNADVFSAYIENPGISPFDRIYGNFSENQAHVQITNSHMDFILEIIDYVEWLKSQSVQADWNQFNFGEINDRYFPATEIGENESVFMNAQIPTHLSQQLPMISSHCEMKTKVFCDEQEIEIHHSGILSIGDATGVSTATLKVTSGTTISVFQNGNLNINPGSKLVMEEGSRLVISEHGIVNCMEGEIVLLPGSSISYSSGELLLIGQASKLLMAGGTVVIKQDATLSLMPENQESGEVVCTAYDQGNYSDWKLERNAVLNIQGFGEADTVVRIASNALWNEEVHPTSRIQIFKGIVSFSDHGQMENRAELDIKDVHFLFGNEIGNDHYELRQIANKSSFSNVFFDHVSMQGEGTQIRLMGIKSVGDEMWEVAKGTWWMSNGGVIGHGLHFTDMHHTWLFEDCILGGEGSDVGIKGNSSSSSTLSMARCEVFDYSDGVIVDHCNFNLSCSKISVCQRGIILNSGAQLIANMTTGNNHFVDNEHHIYLNHALKPKIKDGKNYFDESGSYKMIGSITEGELEELVNEWPGNQWADDAPWISLEWTSASTNTSGYSNSWFVNPQVNYSGCDDSTPEEPSMGYLKSMNSAATIWPNPGIDGLYVQLPLENELGEIKIYSSSGKEVLVENGIAQTVIFCEGNDWAPGIYFIHWRAGDGKQGVLPWVKQ
jgi:hypothetical protein